MIETTNGPEIIRNFQGEYRFLSNFWEAPLVVGEFEFPTAEHAYQAFKCESLEEFERIRQCRSAGEAKRMGRVVKIRWDWEQVKLFTMRDIVTGKFVQNAELMERLLDTGKFLLIEGNNWHDQFWGSCYCRRHVATPGENHLGKILMDIRTNEMIRRTGG